MQGQGPEVENMIREQQQQGSSSVQLKSTTPSLFTNCLTRLAFLQALDCYEPVTNTCSAGVCACCLQHSWAPISRLQSLKRSVSISWCARWETQRIHLVAVLKDIHAGLQLVEIRALPGTAFRAHLVTVAVAGGGRPWQWALPVRLTQSDLAVVR